VRLGEFLDHIGNGQARGLLTGAEATSQAVPGVFEKHPSDALFVNRLGHP